MDGMLFASFPILPRTLSTRHAYSRERADRGQTGHEVIRQPPATPQPAPRSRLEVGKMLSVLRMPAPRPIGGQTPEVEGVCSRPREPEMAQPPLDELLGTLAHELRSP